MSAKRHTAALLLRLGAAACKLSRTILNFSASDQAPPPARVHHLKPFDLGTAPVTVHKDSSQQQASLGKAAFTGRIQYKRTEAKFLVPHTGHASCKVCGATLVM